ncbi:unnamed protein product [Adineta steineri]|uniref:Uncharacterized protein n=2 Tax=Adineta steineri TaxID=433720 RepID=A0A813RW08_9BILA|nr:unnamed protein product [Adineta steineri]
MIKLSAFTIITWYLFYFCDCGSLPDSQLAEQTLITTLLSDYNKNIRPDTQVSVDVSASLQQIVAIDEKQQIMTTSSFISQTWFDYRLSWTPNDTNNNISVLMLPVKTLWIPDTMILNSADASGYLTVSDYSLASVYYTGQVYMILPALTIRTRCNLYVKKFPFDQQICSINITSWSQGSNRILYTENSSLLVDTSGYSEHPVWEMNAIGIVVLEASDRAPFEDTYNDVISIQLYLQRKPLFFIVNGIFACWILNFVTLLSYALSFATQISLCMVCFMTYSVYSLNFSNLFPQQSEYLMMITLYFLLSICWTLISMAWFLIYNYIVTKGEMVKSLYNFCGYLQRIFFCCFPRPKQNSKVDKKNDIIAENGEMKIFENQESTQQMKCVSRLRKQNSIETMEMKQHSSATHTESIKKSSIEVQPWEINKEAKRKCNFCNRCESCQADIDKDKTKSKEKKDIEARCNALNYLVFICVFLLMLIVNITIWLLMSK